MTLGEVSRRRPRFSLAGRLVLLITVMGMASRRLWWSCLGLGGVMAFSLQARPARAEPAASPWYVTGAVGMNWPTMRTNSGSLGSFEEFSYPGAAVELGAGMDLGSVSKKQLVERQWA